MINNISVNGICRELLAHGKFAIFMHENPDADTIGSCLALAEILTSLGRTAVPVCCDKIPTSLLFLSDGVREYPYSEEYKEENGWYLISVDIASPGQFGNLSEIAPKIRLAFDHHSTHDIFSSQYFIDSDASACAEIIYRVLIRLMAGVISQHTASLLYAALAADTGGFRYANTTPYTHKVAAKLIEFGADHTSICHNLFECKSKSAVAAEAFAIENVTYFKNGKISFIKITLQDKKDHCFDDEDTYDVINAIRRIDGVKVAIFAREREDGTYKISTRSTGDVDMAKICGIFGGGGHVGAAGCSVPSSQADDAVRRIINECGFSD